jgi:hypothetical protein
MQTGRANGGEEIVTATLTTLYAYGPQCLSNRCYLDTEACLRRRRLSPFYICNRFAVKLKRKRSSMVILQKKRKQAEGFSSQNCLHVFLECLLVLLFLSCPCGGAIVFIDMRTFKNIHRWFQQRLHQLRSTWQCVGGRIVFCVHERLAKPNGSKFREHRVCSMYDSS